MDFKTFEDQTLTPMAIIGEFHTRMWICDYRHNNVMEKPIRHVPPTEVIIFSNDSLPPNKTIYYSAFHFRPIGKNGEPKKQIIVPFDSTGFRGITGGSVNIFFDEKECREFYAERCKSIKNEVTEVKEQWAKRFDIMLDELDAKISSNS